MNRTSNRQPRSCISVVKECRTVLVRETDHEDHGDGHAGHGDAAVHLRLGVGEEEQRTISEEEYASREVVQGDEDGEGNRSTPCRLSASREQPKGTRRTKRDCVRNGVSIIATGLGIRTEQAAVVTPHLARRGMSGEESGWRWGSRSGEGGGGLAESVHARWSGADGPVRTHGARGEEMKSETEFNPSRDIWRAARAPERHGRGSTSTGNALRDPARWLLGWVNSLLPLLLLPQTLRCPPHGVHHLVHGPSALLGQRIVLSCQRLHRLGSCGEELSITGGSRRDPEEVRLDPDCCC